MAIFMFSLAGIPPLAGFFAKLYVFGGAVEAGMIWLAIIGVINSAIAAYYYLRVTVSMYMDGAEVPAEEQAGRERISGAVWVGVVLAAAGTIVVGLWQQPWIPGITQALASLGR